MFTHFYRFLYSVLKHIFNLKRNISYQFINILNKIALIPLFDNISKGISDNLFQKVSMVFDLKGKMLISLLSLSNQCMFMPTSTTATNHQLHFGLSSCLFHLLRLVQECLVSLQITRA